MGADLRREPDFIDLAARFPTGPIADEQAYHAAIAVLDLLFALPPERSPTERACLHAFARRALAYERAGPARRGVARPVSGLLAMGRRSAPAVRDPDTREEPPCACLRRSPWP